MLHNDGQYTVLDPHKVYEGTYEEIYEEHIASTPIPAGTPLGKGQVSTTSGGDEKANNLSANRIPLFMDPEQTLSLGVFTAFVAVPLNDQSVPGCGQIGVLPGVSMRPAEPSERLELQLTRYGRSQGHHAMEKFFRHQRDNGGVLGPEGADWPRL